MFIRVNDEMEIVYLIIIVLVVFLETFYYFYTMVMDPVMAVNQSHTKFHMNLQ